MAEIEGINSSDAQMAALFGQGRRSATPLDWAKMDLANRSANSDIAKTNADIAGAADNRDIARSELDKRSKMEADRLDFDRQRLDFEKNKMQAEISENQTSRSHDIAMKDKDLDHKVQLEQMALNAANDVRAKELEVAKAKGEDYLVKFNELMQLKEKYSEVGGKLTAYQLLKDKNIAAIDALASGLESYGVDLGKIQSEEKDIGTRTSRSALRRMFEEQSNSSKAERDQIDKLIGDHAAWYTLGVATGYKNVGNELGYQFLSPTAQVLNEQGFSNVNSSEANAGTLAGYGKTLKNWSFGTIPTEYDAKSLVSIDDSKINHHVRRTLEMTLARALSEQTGDKIAPSKIKDVINYVMNGGEGELDQQKLALMLSDAGVSAGAVRASLENMANAIDGVDDKTGKVEGFIGRSEINARKMASQRGSTDEMALDGMLRFYDAFQEKARIAASHFQVGDIKSLQKAANYVRRVKSGDVAFSRSDFEKLIGPIDSRSSTGQMLRDSLLRDSAYDRLEKLGLDPVGQMNKEEGRLTMERDNVAGREAALRGLIENEVVDPSVYDKAIEAYRRQYEYRKK